MPGDVGVGSWIVNSLAGPAAGVSTALCAAYMDGTGTPLHMVPQAVAVGAGGGIAAGILGTLAFAPRLGAVGSLVVVTLGGTAVGYGYAAYTGPERLSATIESAIAEHPTLTLQPGATSATGDLGTVTTPDGAVLRVGLKKTQAGDRTTEAQVVVQPVTPNIHVSLSRPAGYLQDTSSGDNSTSGKKVRVHKDRFDPAKANVQIPGTRPSVIGTLVVDYTKISAQNGTAENAEKKSTNTVIIKWNTPVQLSSQKVTNGPVSLGPAPVSAFGL